MEFMGIPWNIVAAIAILVIMAAVVAWMYFKSSFNKRVRNRAQAAVVTVRSRRGF